MGSFAKTLWVQEFRRKRNHGLTIVEILVLLTIVGILGAMMLPLFLCQAAKAPEAIRWVGAMNTAQMDKYTTRQKFLNSLEDIARKLSMKPSTADYTYSVQTTDQAAFSYGIARRSHTQEFFNRKPLRSYVGAVFVIPPNQAAQSKLKTVSIVCRSQSASRDRPANPVLHKGRPVCAPGTVTVQR